MSIVEAKIPTFDTELRDERDYWVAQLSREIGLSNLRLDFPRRRLFRCEGIVKFTLTELIARAEVERRSTF